MLKLLVVTFKNYLIGMQWNTIKINDGNENRSLTFFNKTKSNIYVSHPIREVLYKEEEDGLQNVIVLILDSLWRDKIGIYDTVTSFDSPTPFIDDYFSKGLKYTNCFSSAEWTLPSVYSMLTSQYPVSHGRTDYRSFTPEFGNERHPSFVEALMKKGISTMANSGAKVFTPAFSGHIGFSRFFYDSYPESGRTDRTVTNRAIEQLRSNEQGKNFLYLHYIDTHDAWTGPSYAEESQLNPIRISNPLSEFVSFKESSGTLKGEPNFGNEQLKLLDRRLDARLNEVDLNLQSLFSYLKKSGLESTTAVILCADHGFQYLGRGRPLLSETRVNVPLLIKHPKLESEDISSFVNLGLDIGPTIANMFSIDLNRKDGRVILPNDDVKPRDIVIIESVFGDRYKVCIRTTEYVFHQHVEYNGENHTIDMNKEVDIFLFEAGNEELNNNLVELKLDVVQKMRSLVIEHLARSADQILWKNKSDI